MRSNLCCGHATSQIRQVWHRISYSLKLTHSVEWTLQLQSRVVCIPTFFLPFSWCSSSLSSTNQTRFVALHGKISPNPKPGCVPSDTARVSQSVTVSRCPLCCTWFDYNSTSARLDWLPRDQWYRRHMIHRFTGHHYDLDLEDNNPIFTTLQLAICN